MGQKRRLSKIPRDNASTQRPSVLPIPAQGSGCFLILRCRNISSDYWRSCGSRDNWFIAHVAPQSKGGTNMKDEQKKALQQTANKVRRGAVEAVYAAQSGHPGGSLSIADVMTYLYFQELRIDPENPRWEDRDRLVLSKGPCLPGTVRGAGAAGLFPGGGAENLPPCGFPPSGTSRSEQVPRCGFHRRFSGTGRFRCCGCGSWQASWR